MTNREDSDSRDRVASIVGVLVNRFEDAIYGIAFLLLVAAAVLVVIGSVDTVMRTVTRHLNTLDAGVLVLDRILLILIIAELAYTLRKVLERHEIAAEPFLFIGLIATVRRILIVTAKFEQPQSNEAVTRLLLQLGALALLVLAIAAAILLIRYSAWKFITRPVDAS